MPPANIVALHRPRTLANVLLDLREARRDWEDADKACQRAPFGSKEEDDASDRMSEADQRVDALREEFAERFVAATGLTWRQVEIAVQESLL